jgi:hypothetical protein
MLPASAQDLSIGYQFQRFSSADDSLIAPLGINADLVLPIATHFGIVGQVDWSRKKESETVFGTSVDSTAPLECSRALDYRRIFSEGEGVNDVRLVAGVRVRLK